MAALLTRLEQKSAMPLSSALTKGGQVNHDSGRCCRSGRRVLGAELQLYVQLNAASALPQMPLTTAPLPMGQVGQNGRVCRITRVAGTTLSARQH